jgi:hypothetical protein
MDDLVSLYTCLKCRARMFERDCAGHYARCVGDGPVVMSAFERGPRTHAGRPGDAVKPLHAPTKRGRRKKRDREPGDELDELDVVD